MGLAVIGKYQSKWAARTASGAPPVCSIEMTSSEPPVRLNVNGRLLPIRLKSEPETVHVHGSTLVSFAALRVISPEHSGYIAIVWQYRSQPELRS